MTIQLFDGGVVLLTKIAPRNVLQTCMDRPLSPEAYGSAAAVALPEVRFATTVPLRSALERQGVTDIFSGMQDPFPGLRSRQPLSDIDQSIVFRIDRFGVGVLATTVDKYALSGGGLVPHHVIFDSPFAVRIRDPEGNDVADAVIDDL